MSKPKGKVPALKLNYPGAGAAWYHATGLQGLFHPEIARPVEDAEQIVKGLKAKNAELEAAWAEHEGQQELDGKRPGGQFPWEEPPCPVELVYLTEEEAQDAQDAYQAALAEARNAIKRARTSGDPETRLLADLEASAISGGEEGTE